MALSREEVIAGKAGIYYADALKIIGDMYDKVFSKREEFGYTKVEIFADFDAYLQAALIKLCANNDKFGKSQMYFIENTGSYGKLLEGTDFNLFADCVKDMRDMLSEKADERLKIIPICFKMSAAVDSAHSLGATKILSDDIIKIAFYLKLLDESADIKNNSDITKALRNLFNFTQGMKL